MPAKRAPAPSAVPPSTGSPARGQTSGSSQPTRATPSTPAKNPVTQKSSLSTNANANIKNAQDAQEILTGIWNRYVDDTPQRTKLIDVFMAFLVVVGGLQFVYCVLAGNYVGPSLSTTVYGKDPSGQELVSVGSRRPARIMRHWVEE